ncbi:MAG: GNAT family N-acetyltransferase [Candidatus Peribacteraceae bacterium]|nr:GNAT family N-acetyltransferase [Candidatus Peribacteraceae bacterium]
MFNRVLNDKLLAQQVASLINNNNHLNKYYSSQEVLSQKDTYVVETLGSIVIGSIQIVKQAYILSEICHLVVHPEMRKQGVAKILILAAIKKSTTPMVYATIRKNNTGSRKAFKSCGFLNVGHYTTGNRDVLLYVSTCKRWKKQIDITQSPDYTNTHRR